MANDEQNHLAKYIKEFETKAKPQKNYSLKKVKEDELNTAMPLLKGRETVFKAFESKIFLLKPVKLKQSEQSNQSNSDDKYTSLKLDNDLNTLNDSFKIQTSHYLHQKEEQGSKY